MYRFNIYLSHEKYVGVYESYLSYKEDIAEAMVAAAEYAESLLKYYRKGFTYRIELA